MIDNILDVYQKSMNTQFRDLIFTEFRFNKHRIIILLGISSSGKSSISNKMEEMKTGIKSIEIDDVIRATTVRILSERIGDQFIKIHAKYGKNTLHFIFDDRNHPSFAAVLDDLDELNQLQTNALSYTEEIKNTAHNVVLESAKKVCSNFGIAVCQAISLKNLARFHEFDPYLVIIQCSLLKVLFNVRERNRRSEVTNDMVNIRSEVEVYKQFNQLFSYQNNKSLYRLINQQINTDHYAPAECAELILSGFKENRPRNAPKYKN